MAGDRWARWLMHGRDGGDPGLRERTQAVLGAYRDGVLERAGVRAGDTVLDVGCGDGLIGFGALARVAAGGSVVFSDISADLLDECRRRAAALGVLARCRFVQAPAEDLRGVTDGSVDVVTTRSVLIYVEDRPAAFAEFARVLRPGGRLSIFEPINSFALQAGPVSPFGLDLAPVADLMAKVWQAYAPVPAARNPMADFDERDLLRWVAGTGFTEIRMDYRAEVGVPAPLPCTDWEMLKKTAPNPLAPSYQEAIAQTLTGPEQQRFEQHLRAVLEAGTPARMSLATVYLSGTRP